MSASSRRQRRAAARVAAGHFVEGLALLENARRSCENGLRCGRRRWRRILILQRAGTAEAAKCTATANEVSAVLLRAGAAAGARRAGHGGERRRPREQDGFCASFGKPSRRHLSPGTRRSSSGRTPGPVTRARATGGKRRPRPPTAAMARV